MSDEARKVEVSIGGESLGEFEMTAEIRVPATQQQMLAAEDYAAEIGPWALAADLGCHPDCRLPFVAYLEASVVAPELWETLIPAILRGFARYLRGHGEHSYIDWKESPAT